ncbi:T9SS type A sorting domain-containing protein [Winogradskyella sp.]|nr:T9SS type A sorting domain-containing protein [Winogradskyella sp.]
MRQFYVFLVAILFTSLGFGQIISQYVETNSGTTPKGIEIWNNTGSTLDFSTNNLVIEKGNNGGTPSIDFTLNTGTLASEAVLVIGTSDMETVTLTNGSAFYLKAFTYNGNDALVVKYGGTITDMFGIAGSDPGSSWSGSGVSTADQNLELNNGITTGDTDGWTDPSTRFSTINTNPSGTNGDEGFGIAPSAPSADTSVQFTSAASSVSESVGTIDLTFEITNEDAANATSFDVVLTGGNGDASDINNYTTQTVTFAANSSTDETLTITLTDDLLSEGDETLTFTIQNVTGGTSASAGTNDSFELTIIDNEILPDPTIIAIQNFDGAAPNWTYTNDIPFFDNEWGSGFYGIIDITAASPINQNNLTNNILGENDLDDEGNGTTGFATTTFANINIANFSNVVLSFDWDVVGYNANNDDAKYEVFYDGISQGESFLLDGNGAPEDNEGTLTINVPNTVNEISLLIAVRNNGGDGYSGFDNFKLEGLYNGLTYANGSWSPEEPSSTTNLSNAIIVNGEYTLTADVSLNDVFVYPAAAISIPSGITFTANSLNLESNATAYASLIRDGAIAGNALDNVVYHRFVNNFTAGNGGNDLVASPLTGLTFFNFATDPNNTNLYANPSPANSDEAQYLFGPYDNSSTLSYINYSIGLDAFGNADQSNTNYDNNQVLTTGKGYRAATTGTTGATLTFRGGVNSGTVTTTDFQALGNAPIDKWNLIGNPYPSYIDAQTFLTTNGGAIDESVLDPSFNAIYGYNDNTDNTTTRKWTIINNLQNNTLNIAPGQGFFVASNNTGQLNFTPAMRVSSGGDDFIQGRTDHTVYQTTLKLSQPNDSFNTDFYFTNAATQGLNPGYDAGLFGGAAAPFALYSHLVQDNQGVPFAIQALGGTDYTNVTIALGVNAAQGEQLTFSITASNLPNNAEVYLEDNVTNIYTLLNNANYVVTPSTDLNGTGRFFLHFTNNVLGVVDNSLNNLNIYTNQNDRTVVISGELKTKTTARLYDLQGRLVITTLLNTNSRLQKINTTNLSTGIYIIKLTDSTNQNITQKIILK